MALGNSLIICAFVFSIVAFIFAAFSLVKCLAFERSTHKVMMYNPSEQEFTTTTEEEKAAILRNSWEDDLIK